MTQKNKYNYEIISPNSNGVLILNTFNKFYVFYQFITCKSKEINFKIESSLYDYEYFDKNEYPYQEIINKTKYEVKNLHFKDMSLFHSFESNNEFIFFYSFEESVCEINDKSSILSIYDKEENIIHIIFESGFSDCTRASISINYQIIIAKNDNLNNNDSFSNPCYLSNLLLENNDSIIIESIDDYSFENGVVFTDININKLNLNKNNNELIITIFSYNTLIINGLKFYSPIQYKIGENPVTQFKLGEEVIFNLKNKNYFKLEYNHESVHPLIIYFYFDGYGEFNLAFIDNLKIEKKLSINKLVNITLIKSGTYYFHISDENNWNSDINYSFRTISFENVIDTINLNESKYFKEIKLEDIKYYEYLYKVKDIKEDKLYYFYYDIYKNSDININPIEICNDKNGQCIKNISIYRFLKDNEYTIKLHFVYESYFFSSFSFEYISSNSIEEIVNGYKFTSDLKIYFINLKNKDEFNIYGFNITHMILAYTNESITLDNIEKLKYEKITNPYRIYKNKYDKYAVILLVPSKDVNSIFFALDEIFKFQYYNYKYTLSAKKNILIIPDDIFEERKKNNPFNYYNILQIFSSSKKNMRIISTNFSTEKYDYIIENSFSSPLYIENINAADYSYFINASIVPYGHDYCPFAYFTGLNDNLLDEYLSVLDRLISLIGVNLNLYNYLQSNFRINSDIFGLYEFFNFYLKNFQNKINIYIKKYFGKTNFYEYNSDSIDKNELDFLNSPIITLNGMKSLYKKTNIFSGSKLIFGYLDYNSYFDVFLDINENDTKIIIPEISKSFSNNIAKLLKEGIEYTLDFKVNHLVKIEPQFNAEVSIYKDSDFKVILNSKKLTANIEGNNLKIKSNHDVMVYFYSKLFEGFNQIKIDPEKKGKNYEIKIPANTIFYLDFGFEGYNPVDISSTLNKKALKKNMTFYVENIYDKLTTELIEGEYLYLYHNTSNDKIEIKYEYENLNIPSNPYNFMVIPKNFEKNEEKSLIINNINNYKIKYQILFCKSNNKIEMTYHEADSSINIIEFNNENKEIEQSIDYNPFKLTFKSKEDFVFHYSLIDNVDYNAYISDNHAYRRYKREEILNPTILSIYKSNNEFINSNIFNISLQSNYLHSTTEYIFITGIIDENNSLENLSNPCYLTKLLTENRKDINIINLYNVGDSDIINTTIETVDSQNKRIENFVVVISREIRFAKKIYFYRPFIFLNSKEEPIQFEYGSMQTFDVINNQIYFEFSYSKNSDKNEMFLLNYKLESQNDIIIQIYHPNGYGEYFTINNDEGFINFLCDKNGTYNIYFNSSVRNQFKLNNNIDIKGQFRIVSTESPFILDIAQENIEFNEFNLTGNQSNSLKFKVEALKKNYIKKISIGNFDFDEINEIISISQNNKEFKPLNFNYFAFENNSNYTVDIKFIKKEGYYSTLEKINIKDFSTEYIQKISEGNKTYNEVNDRFLIINWTNYKNIEINTKKNNPRFILSDLTEDQSKNLEKELQNINFIKLDDLNLNLTKPNNTNYSVLIVELFEPNTEISFILNSINNDKDDKDGKDDKEKSDESEGEGDKTENDDNGGGISTLAIILISMLGVLIIIIIIFLVFRYLNKNKGNVVDFSKQTKTLDNEKLLLDI